MPRDYDGMQCFVHWLLGRAKKIEYQGPTPLRLLKSSQMLMKIKQSRGTTDDAVGSENEDDEVGGEVMDSARRDWLRNRADFFDSHFGTDAEEENGKKAQDDFPDDYLYVEELPSDVVERMRLA